MSMLDQRVFPSSSTQIVTWTPSWGWQIIGYEVDNYSSRWLLLNNQIHVPPLTIGYKSNFRPSVASISVAFTTSPLTTPGSGGMTIAGIYDNQAVITVHPEEIAENQGYSKAGANYNQDSAYPAWIYNFPSYWITKPFIAQTGTETNVASSASSVTILAQNYNRIGATIFNDSTQILYLFLGSAAASTTNYTVQMAPLSYYEVPFAYIDIIKGIWASANGNARVTELT